MLAAAVLTLGSKTDQLLWLRRVLERIVKMAELEVWPLVGLALPNIQAAMVAATPTLELMVHQGAAGPQGLTETVPLEEIMERFPVQVVAAAVAALQVRA